MNLIDNIEKNGKIERYDLDGELDTLVRLPNSKPSKKIIKTRKGKIAIGALKEIEDKHNHSWYKELQLRAKKNPNALALFYRGNKISFQEMFDRADCVAKSLAKCGIKNGDEIPVCISNVPELVYIMLAANKIGAKINLFGSHLDPDYLEMILDNCTDKIIIASDDIYGDIKNVVNKKDYNKKLIISLADSLPKNPKDCDEYEPQLDEYYHYENKVSNYKSNDSTIMSFNDFINFGSNYNESIVDCGNLDTEFLTTYTSGSTKVGFPSQLVHTNRSLIVSGIFHDAKLSGNPEIKGLRGLAHIHPESNTDVITCISDNLMQLWSVAMEPEYDKDKFCDYVFLNKPNYLNATTSFYVNFAKKYLFDSNYKFHNRKMPFLFAAFAVGEKTSKGEEKLINKMLRKSRAGSGIRVSGLSLPFTTLCVGGGDCEHGGIYYSLWKALFEKIYKFKLRKREYGLMPEGYVHVTALKKVGDGPLLECDYNECGIIVANSATTMSGYKDNKEKTKSLILRDVYGRDWVSANVYGYIDELGGVHVKGRIGNEITLSSGKSIHLFIIEDIVESDTKNILSCSANISSDKIVLNVELFPDNELSNNKIIESIFSRCFSLLPKELCDMLVVRIIDNKDSYPLTGSGKRSVVALENMGLDDTYYLNNGVVSKFAENNKVKCYK